LGIGFFVISCFAAEGVRSLRAIGDEAGFNAIPQVNGTGRETAAA
jgi:hypothetical protein